MADGLLDEHEAAQRLGIAVSSLREYINSGRLKYTARAEERQPGSGRAYYPLLFCEADLTEYAAQRAEGNACKGSHARKVLSEEALQRIITKLKRTRMSLRAIAEGEVISHESVRQIAIDAGIDTKERTR